MVTVMLYKDHADHSGRRELRRREAASRSLPLRWDRTRDKFKKEGMGCLALTPGEQVATK
jgi:hypothetical protein